MGEWRWVRIYNVVLRQIRRCFLAAAVDESDYIAARDVAADGMIGILSQQELLTDDDNDRQ